MPGHTKGCLAWSTDLKENGKTYYTFIECSLNSQAMKFVGNTDYPEIVDDFRATYKKARTFPVEVLVSSHASFYGLAGEVREAAEARRREIRIRSSTPRATRLTSTSTRRTSRPRWLGSKPSLRAPGKGKQEK